MELVGQLDTGRLDWTEFVPEFRKPVVAKAAILKPFVGPSEKGVLFISFENEWIRLLSLPNFRELAERLQRRPVAFLKLAARSHQLRLPGRVSRTDFHAHQQYQRSRRFSAYVEQPGCGPAVRFELGQPGPVRAAAAQGTKLDLLMVANWAKFKRHQVLFAALRTMPDLRRSSARTRMAARPRTIRELARWYGVLDRLTIMSQVPYREVAKVFCQAGPAWCCRGGRIVRGHCRVSFLADTPAAMLRDAEIGSASPSSTSKRADFLDEPQITGP